MIFLKNNFRLLLAMAFIVLMLNSCKKFSGDVTIPAYLHLDRIDVVPQSSSAPSVEPGFYSSLVDAVELVCLFEGDNAETRLGTYQLPCTVPVLHYGTMTYLKVVPCVKQNGISASRISYPFYQVIRLDNMHLAADSTTNIGQYDPDRHDWFLHANYLNSNQIKVLAVDFFEPTSFTTSFDSMMVWEKNDPENACTGQGYGHVHANDSIVAFHLNNEFTSNQLRPTDLLYLEMDYWTDVELMIGMAGFEVGGSNQSQKEVMRLYANKGWQKIYINLGKTWSQFNYNLPIGIFFQANNPDKKEGYVRFDNFKIIAM